MSLRYPASVTSKPFLRPACVVLCAGVAALCAVPRQAGAAAAAAATRLPPPADHAAATLQPPVVLQRPAAADAAPPDANVTATPVDAFDLYYGIYVGGQKVGWMHSGLVLGSQPRLTLELRAKVSGMGQASDITMDERRVYDGAHGRLRELHFAQGAATGRVQVRGQRSGEDLALTITAGGQQQQQKLPVAENLDDATALYRLGKSGRVGTKVHAAHFDPSIQKVCQVDYSVDAEETRVLAGVETRTVKVTANYPDLGVSETSWLDSSGKLLESRIGGFFVARLEAPEVAKKLDYSQDLLVSAVVAAPRELAMPQQLESLALTFTGFGEVTPPTSPRQQVRRDGEAIHLTLSRDPMPPKEPLGQPPTGAGDANALAAVWEALVPTPFIQSGAPVLVKAARRAVCNATDVMTASSRLQHFVYTYLKSEYVPAFSNALEAFNSRRGDCTEHSVLFVALARAVKIPARVAVGVAYWPPGNGFGWHAWAEIWAGGRWIAVDPTWDQPIADATHIKLADGGPAEQARIVMLLGQLKITDMQAQPQ